MNIFYHTNSEEGKSVPTVREAAGSYIDRGWNPVPIAFRSKKPSAGAEWQNIKIDHNNADEYFNGAPQNIGVQMGPASDGLVDNDLDCPEALALGPSIMPPTDCIFGRKSTHGSHRLYVADVEIVDRAAIAFDDPNYEGKEARMLELRVGGGGKAAQSVFPPSEHKETGELICWEKYGEPARVVGRDLLRAARLLAVCCLLARYWPATGSGCHDAALAVGGLLARAGLTAEEVERLVAAVTKFQNPERSDELSRTAEDAATTYLGGKERTYGLPKFAKLFGQAVADQVAEWLEYSSATSAGAEKRAFEDWPEPTPLPSGLLKVPALDPLMLPKKLAPWLQDIGDRMQIPLDFLGLPAMAAFGSAIGCKVGIRPKRQDDWTEVANIWVIIIARPGFMKSPAVSEILKPVHFMMSAAAVEYSSRLKEYELDADIYKHRRSKAIKSEGGERFTDPAPEEPKHRRYITNDSTYEKLCEIMRDNPSGVLLHRDEIVSLLRYLDREENSQARGFYLTAWGGTQRYDSDRIARGAIHVDSACLSALGTTQPGVMAEYVRRATTGGAGDDGLIQRFNHVWPDTSPEWENVDRYPQKEPRDTAWNTFKRLAGATWTDFGATQEEYDRFPWLRFTHDAQVEFELWRSKLEGRIRGGELPLAIESHIAKYRGLVPRLALITHLIDKEKGPVEHEAVLKALALSEYLEAHAARLYAAGAEPARVAARAILAKIRAGALKDRFTARDVYMHHWAGASDPDHVQIGLDLLCEHNWIAADHIDTGGRPRVEYLVNPRGKA